MATGNLANSGWGLPLLAYALQELCLATGPGGALTADAYRRVVQAFIVARLLTSHGDDNATLEVAHEALFRSWILLRQAIEASAD